ncbi:metallophosphoesterase [Sulfurospirillum cavolei]|uniref:metallophosphoesterase n=1 Tax=Sulfurospirillum cavolei TaxID=366522 RepID=UPI0007649CD9|nr:metallophosphoesterase [Sulfurospirillum cavolei]
MFEKGYEKLNLKRMMLSIEHLPSSFENFTIVHLSDLHVNAKTPLHALETLVAKINELHIDMVALTGDLFDAKPSRIRTQLEVLKQIKHPVYFVSGNHDLLFTCKTLRSEIEALGFTLLDNRIVTLHKEDARLQLMGLSDAFSAYFGIKRHEKELFATLDPHLPTLLLAHQPKDIRFAKHFRVDVQLSGHTHGGQIYPFGYIVRLFQPYLHGLHVKDKTQIFVTTGYGCWGFNLRFKAPSEVVIIRLVGAKDAD